MNKKLIALVLATLPAAAMADVTLYGDIEAGFISGKGLSFAQQNAAGQTVLKNVSKIDDTGSYIGFKGNEDLGNGLKAIWQVEQSLNIAGTGTAAQADRSSSGAFATRDSFVGLSSNSFGTVRLGHLSTYLNSDMEKVDPWIYHSTNNGLNTLTANDGRLNNSIRYDAPSIVPGLKVTAQYGFDEKRVVAPSGRRSNAGIYSFGLGYENSGFFGDIGYEGQRDQGANLDQTAYYWRTEAGYNANNLLVAAAFQQTKGYAGSSNFAVGNFDAGVYPHATGTSDVKQNEAALTVGYTIGAFTPMASYAKGWDAKVGGAKQDNTGYDQFVVGVNYALSKRTNTYISYGQKKFDSALATAVTNGSGDKENTFALGLQHKF